VDRAILVMVVVVAAGCYSDREVSYSAPLLIRLGEPVPVGPERIRIDISVHNTSDARVTVYDFTRPAEEPTARVDLMVAPNRKDLEADPPVTPGRYYVDNVVLEPGETMAEYDEVDTTDCDHLFLQASWFSLDYDSECRSNVVEWRRSRH